MLFVNVGKDDIDLMRRTGELDELGADNIHQTIREAVGYAQTTAETSGHHVGKEVHPMGISSSKQSLPGGLKSNGDASMSGEASQESIVPAVHLTVAERVATGRAARAEVGRGSHAAWEPSSDRPDPVDLFEQQAANRVKELVPIRYGRMLVSPLNFYRGAAYLMASDLAGMPRTGLHVQLCGDAHLSNFGYYAAPDRQIVFDVNDFDETLPGPFEWDLKRLVASFAVAGRSFGFGESARRKINLTVGRAYREAMAEFASNREMQTWYARTVVDQGFFEQFRSRVGKKAVARAEKNVEKARSRDHLRAFSKLTEIVAGERRFASDPPMIMPLADLATDEQAVDTPRDVIRAYRESIDGNRRRLFDRFRYVDLARKAVGVGSVGTRCWVALFLGRGNDDPLILQIKEAEASVLEPFLGKSRFRNHGRRVVEGQQLMQATSDPMLGWIRVKDSVGIKRDFYVRQRWDAKGSALIDAMKPKTMRVYAQLCAGILARAHARSGDAVAISSYLGRSDKFDRGLATFAETYADQNERDYASLKAAADAGQIEVQSLS